MLGQRTELLQTHNRLVTAFRHLSIARADLDITREGLADTNKTVAEVLEILAKLVEEQDKKDKKPLSAARRVMRRLKKVLDLRQVAPALRNKFKPKKIQPTSDNTENVGNKEAAVTLPATDRPSE